MAFKPVYTEAFKSLHTLGEPLFEPHVHWGQAALHAFGCVTQQCSVSPTPYSDSDSDKMGEYLTRMRIAHQ